MKRALITGASRGIGRAIAEELANDHHIIAGASKEASEVVAALPSAEPFEVDLRDIDALQRAVANIGELDVLVHAAGVLHKAPLEELDVSHWRESFAVNVLAPVVLTQALLPALRRSRGIVLTLNSGAGFHGIEEHTAYCASKFALRGFTDSLRLEEHGRLRVTSLHPGRTDTDMIADPKYGARPKMDPTSVAKAARLAIDAGPDATVEFLRIAPSGLQ